MGNYVVMRGTDAIYQRYAPSSHTDCHSGSKLDGNKIYDNPDSAESLSSFVKTYDVNTEELL